jgi:hypothetical protein
MKITPPGFEIKPLAIGIDIDADADISTYIDAHRHPIIAQHFFGVVVPMTTSEREPTGLAA